MKINNISFIQHSPVLKLKSDKKYNTPFCSFCSYKEEEIIKSLSSGEKMVLRGSNCAHPKYIGFLDDNGNVIRDIRFDRRYNEIRAIEYQKPLGGFNYIKNSVSVSFDDNQKIRNVYLISNDKGYNFHNVLNIKYGHTVSVYDGEQNNIILNDNDKKGLLDFIVDYTKRALQEAQDNNLIGSENVLNKFSDFTRAIL